MTNKNKEKLETTFIKHGFVKKKNRFFRVVGDGVIQFVVFRREPPFRSLRLSIELSTMYGQEIEKSYSDVAVIDVAEFLGETLLDYMDMETHERYIYEQMTYGITRIGDNLDGVELDVAFEEEILPWLDKINTHKELSRALIDMDIKRCGEQVWIASPKLIPYLVNGEYEAAEKVIFSHIKQYFVEDWLATQLTEKQLENHRQNIYDPTVRIDKTKHDKWRATPLTEEEYDEFKRRHPDKQERFIKIHDWLVAKDYDAINEFLAQNYKLNKRVFKK